MSGEKLLKVAVPSTLASRAAAAAERPLVVKRRRPGRLVYGQPVTIPARVPVAERTVGPQIITVARRGGELTTTNEENDR